MITELDEKVLVETVLRGYDLRNSDSEENGYRQNFSKNISTRDLTQMVNNCFFEERFFDSKKITNGSKNYDYVLIKVGPDRLVVRNNTSSRVANYRKQVSLHQDTRMWDLTEGGNAIYSDDTKDGELVFSGRGELEHLEIYFYDGRSSIVLEIGRYKMAGAVDDSIEIPKNDSVKIKSNEDKKIG